MAEKPVAGVPRVPSDPYSLDPADILNPPHGWGESLKFLGPGMIVSASIVGSGELIATTAAGAQAGFVILWVVLVSCAVKVALQVELARYVIATGTPTINGYNLVPPKFGRLSWTMWLWMVFAASKWIQSAGIVGGVALAFNIWIPISLEIWTAIVVVGTIVLLFSNAYGWIEKGAFYLVVVFTIITVLIAFGLPFTPTLGYSAAELASGLTFSLPAAAVGAAVAMFGITGVGADEITMYPYWALEKGYARWTGPNDGSQAWVDRAKGWLNVMYKDVFVSFVIYTFATMAFFIMGASVLHRQGLAPQGNDMIIVLSRMYTDTLGVWASTIFLIGAIAVLGSTLWAAVPSWSRQWTNWMAVAGFIDWDNPQQRLRTIRGWTIFLPVVWGVVYLFVQSPVIMVQIGGITTALYLIVVVIATLYLRQKYTDRRLYGGGAFNILLVLSSIAIGILGIYSLLQVFGFRIA